MTKQVSPFEYNMSRILQTLEISQNWEIYKHAITVSEGQRKNIPKKENGITHYCFYTLQREMMI